MESNIFTKKTDDVGRAVEHDPVIQQVAWNIFVDTIRQLKPL